MLKYKDEVAIGRDYYMISMTWFRKRAGIIFFLFKEAN